MSTWPANRPWLREQVIELLGSLPTRLDTASWIASGLVPTGDLVAYTLERWLPPGNGPLNHEAYEAAKATVLEIVDELVREGRAARLFHDRSAENLYELDCVRQLSLLEAVAKAATEEADRAGTALLGEEGDRPRAPQEQNRGAASRGVDPVDPTDQVFAPRVP